MSQQEADYIYSALSHPARRRIIEILGEKGGVGFNEFKKVLSLPTGTIYYHFDSLKGLIKQLDDRRYALTDIGIRAYNVLNSNTHEEILSGATPLLTARKHSHLKQIFVPYGFMEVLYHHRPIALLGGMLIIAFGAWVTGQQRLQSFGFFFRPSAYNSIYLIGSFLAGWLALFVMADALSWLFYQRGHGHLQLLAGSLYSLLPLLAIPAVVYFGSTSWIGIELLRNQELAKNLSLLLLGWAVAIFTAAISKAKDIRLDKAGFVAVVVSYLNLMFLYIAGA